MSVALAAHTLALKRPEIQCWKSETLGRALVFPRHDEVTSCAIARASRSTASSMIAAATRDTLN